MLLDHCRRQAYKSISYLRYNEISLLPNSKNIQINYAGFIFQYALLPNTRLDESIITSSDRLSGYRCGALQQQYFRLTTLIPKM